MWELSDRHLITRRRSLAVFGATASGLVLAGAPRWIDPTGGGVAEADDHVADAATACTLTAEQEEGPFYVALDRVRSDITEDQAGLPLTLKITLIDSQTCKPLKGAAVDIWLANGSGAYSDESSESTLGQTYLRGVQFTDKHGQVTFKTIYPGHYSGRTTHIHAKVHISSGQAKGRLTGGHVAHTGQIFPADAINAEVYKLSPYTAESATIVTHSQDRVWTAQHGSESQLKIARVGSRLSSGLIGTVVLAVNPSAVPAAVGVSGRGGGGGGGGGGMPGGGTWLRGARAGADPGKPASGAPRPREVSPSVWVARLAGVYGSRREEWVTWTTVADALAHRTVGDLKQLATAASIGGGGRKRDLVDRLAGQLEGEPMVALWSRLGRLERAAISEVVHGPEGRFLADRFRAKYGGDPDWGARDRWSSSSSLLSLFIHDRVIPDDLLARLGPLVPAPAKTAIRPVGELPTAIERRGEHYDYATRERETWTEAVPLVVDERERSAPGELAGVLRLIEARKVAVSDKTRRPSGAAMRVVAGVLEGGDFYADDEIGPIRAFAWPMLVQAGGLAERAGPRLRLTAAGRRALAEPAAATLRRLWERWVATRLVDELGRVNAIRGQTGKGKRGLTAVAGRREAIAAGLGDCPVGEWIEVDELFRYMRAAGHDFEVTRDAWTLYIGDPQYGSLGYDGYGGWEILQARYALCVLFEYAATLGLIDVAYVPPAETREDFHELSGAQDLEYLSRYDGLSYVRITPLGGYCMGVVDEYRPPRVEVRGVLSVLSTFEIVATREGLSGADRVVLDRYADSTSDDVWLLSTPRLLAGLEASGSLDELGEFLAARSVTPIPPTVTQLLSDLQARAGALQDGGDARLIVCTDAALATLVANHTKTRRLCLLAGERHLVVPARSERAFRRVVREIGYPLGAAGCGDAA